MSMFGAAGFAQADTNLSFSEIASDVSGSVSIDTPFGSQTSAVGPSIGDSAYASVSGVYEGQPTDPGDLPFLNYSASASLVGNSFSSGFTPGVSVSAMTSGGNFAQFAATSFTATIHWNVTLTNTTSETGRLVVTTRSSGPIQPIGQTILWNGQAIRAEPFADGRYVPHDYFLGTFAPGQSGVLSFVATDSHSFAQTYTGSPSSFPNPAFVDQFGISGYRIASPVAAVPEPASGALLALAMGGLLLSYRRRSRTSD